MNTIAKIDQYSVIALDKKIAEQYSREFVAILNLIPQVTYSESDLLAEEKKGVFLYGKWELSIALFDKEKPIGILIVYERPAEENDIYPEPSLYINCISIHEDYQRQGLGRKMMRLFLDHHSIQSSPRHIPGVISCSVQTNSDPTNAHVRRLYESLGFMVKGMKKYENRVDLVLWKSI